VKNINANLRARILFMSTIIAPVHPLRGVPELAIAEPEKLTLSLKVQPARSMMIGSLSHL
jgi:hypothetical protein